MQLELQGKVLEDDFDAFVHSPRGGEIANLAIRLSLQKFREGHTRYSIQRIIESIRWDHGVRDVLRDPTAPPGTHQHYKVPHKFRALLGRFVMERAPTLKGFFRQAPRPQTARSTVVHVSNLTRQKIARLHDLEAEVIRLRRELHECREKLKLSIDKM